MLLNRRATVVWRLVDGHWWRRVRASGRRSDGALRAKRLLRGFDQPVMRSPWRAKYARTPNRYVWGTEAPRLAHQGAPLLPPGPRAT